MSAEKKLKVVKNPKNTGFAHLILSKKIYQLPIAVWLIFIFSLLTRIPLILNDLPPYQFCDETVYQNDVIRMVSENDWIPKEFRAGGFNIYPAYFLFQLINLFLPTPLDSLQMLVIGRILYALLLPGISILFVFKISNLFVGKIPSIITSFLFSVSILHYVNFWYPDTYIQFGILGFLYFALLILLDINQSVRSYLYLGIFLSVAISTKYTALALLAPALLLLLYQFSKRHQIKEFWKKSMTSIGIFLFLTVLLNFGAVLRTKSFISGFLFNLNNYGSTVETRYDGFLYYAAVLLINSFTVFGFFYLIVGIVISRRDKFILIFLALYPLILILLLGDKRWVIARNMTSASSFLIPFIAIGISWGIQRIKSTNQIMRKSFILIISTSLFVPVVSYGYLVTKDISTDTRILSANWISSNIERSVTVGVNEFCSGSSPAQVAGNTVIIDPTLAQNLKYYVLNSYWVNPVSNKYLEKGVLSLIDQSKIHFEQWNSTKLIGPLGTVNLTESDFSENYEIMKLVRGNGPDIIILKRVDK